MEERAGGLRLGQSELLRRLLTEGVLINEVPPGVFGISNKKEKASEIVGHINFMRQKVLIYKGKIEQNESISIEELSELVAHMQRMIDKFVAILSVR